MNTQRAIWLEYPFGRHALSPPPPQKFKINCDEKLEFSMAKCLKYHGKINSFCFRGGTNMSLKVGNKLLSQLAFSESQRELGNSKNKILFPKIF